MIFEVIEKFPVYRYLYYAANSKEEALAQYSDGVQPIDESLEYGDEEDAIYIGITQTE